MTILFAWLLADFISGLVHWWEDRAIVGASRFAFINGVRMDNERHHTEPRYFLQLSYWENINTTAPIAWTATVALLFVGAPDGGPHLWTKFSHNYDKREGDFICSLDGGNLEKLAAAAVQGLVEDLEVLKK